MGIFFPSESEPNKYDESYSEPIYYKSKQDRGFNLLNITFCYKGDSGKTKYI